MSRTTKSQNSRKAPVRRAGRNSTTQASSCAESPAPRSAPAELIKLGVDTHAGHYTFARMVDNQNAQPAQKLSPEQFLEFLARQKTLARRVVMVYEAGPYGFSLYRQVTAMGVECVVCAPERLSRGRKRINDKIDAKELLSRLDRHLAGNTTALRMVRPPTIEQEMSRREARERNTYRKDRQRWIARGRSLLHTLGIARPGRWWEMDRFLELKKILLERYGQTVADGATAELDRYLEFVHLAAGKLEALTVVLQKSAEEKKLPRESRGSGLSAANCWTARSATGTGLPTAVRWPAIPGCARGKSPPATRACSWGSTNTATRACARCSWNWHGCCRVTSRTTSRWPDGSGSLIQGRRLRRR